MTRALWFILKVAALIVAGVWIAEHSGPVVFTWRGEGQAYRVETELAWLVLAIVLVAITAALLYRMWMATRRAPTSVKQYRQSRRREAGMRALTQGLAAVSAGDSALALKQARKAEKLLHDPTLTLLLTAEASQIAGNQPAAHEAFTRMLENPELEAVGLRGLLLQARQAGRHDEALDLARRLYARLPKTPWVVTTLFDVQVHAGLWREAEETLKKALKAKVVSDDTARRYRAALLVEISRKEETAGHETEARREAATAQSLNPGLVPAALQHARLLDREGKTSKALRVLEDAWQHGPHPDLAAVYVALGSGGNALARVKRAERLQSLSPESAEGHLALAEAALDARLWGEARKHLMQAETTASGGRVYRLLARLEEGEHRNTEAARLWLTRAADAPPERTWTCSSCGTATADWHALCPHCRAFDTLIWSTPRAIVMLPEQSREIASTGLEKKETLSLQSGGNSVQVAE